MKHNTSKRTNLIVTTTKRCDPKKDRNYDKSLWDRCKKLKKLISEGLPYFHEMTWTWDGVTNSDRVGHFRLIWSKNSKPAKLQISEEIVVNFLFWCAWFALMPSLLSPCKSPPRIRLGYRPSSENSVSFNWIFRLLPCQRDVYLNVASIFTDRVCSWLLQESPSLSARPTGLKQSRISGEVTHFFYCKFWTNRK